MTIINVFDYNGDIKNPVSKKITLQKQLFDEDEVGIAHIYPSYNIIFVESDKSVRKENIPLDNIYHFVPNRNNFYNFFKQISSAIEKLNVISSSGESYDVVQQSQLDSTLRHATVIINTAEFKYKDKTVYYEMHKLEVPDTVPKTDLMIKFASTIR